MKSGILAFVRNENGQALLLVTVTVALASLLMVSLFSITCKTRENLLKEQAFTRALMAADAGVEITLARVQSDIDWYKSIPFSTGNSLVEIVSVTELPDGTLFRVEGARNKEVLGTTLQLNSVGMVTGENGAMLARKTICPRLAVFTAGDFLIGLSILAGDDQVATLSGGITVNGRLVVSDSIDLSAGIDVNGDVIAGGKVRGTCSGKIYELYRYVPAFPDLDTAYYRHKALTGGQCFYGDTTFSNQFFTDDSGQLVETPTGYSGFYYVEGDINISGDYYGNALIFATGDINISGNLAPGFIAGGDPDTGAGSITLVSQGDINIHNNNVYACLVARGQIRYSDGAVINGAACATGVSPATGNAGLTLNCEPDITPQPDYLPVQARIDLWKELYQVI